MNLAGAPRRWLLFFMDISSSSVYENALRWATLPEVLRERYRSKRAKM
jgi:hypothetical protein